jgi:hypothetical protein
VLSNQRFERIVVAGNCPPHKFVISGRLLDLVLAALFTSQVCRFRDAQSILWRNRVLGAQGRFGNRAA